MNRTPQVGIGIMVLKNSQVLLSRRKGSHGAGEYAFPGGHLEFGESIRQCARREVAEETGLKIKNIRFLPHFAESLGRQPEDEGEWGTPRSSGGAKWGWGIRLRWVPLAAQQRGALLRQRPRASARGASLVENILSYHNKHYLHIGLIADWQSGLPR